MDNKKSLSQFETVCAWWQKELEHYPLEKLLKKPADDSWSLGQLYLHLINSTLNFHLPEAQKCEQSMDNAGKNKKPPGVVTYKLLGGIPPIRIKVPPSNTYTPPQPESKKQIEEGLAQTLEAMQRSMPVKQAKEQGKTEHPGLGFLNADEWYRLAAMHFNHHRLQKKRIDKFLTSTP